MISYQLLDWYYWWSMKELQLMIYLNHITTSNAPTNNAQEYFDKKYNRKKQIWQ